MSHPTLRYKDKKTGKIVVNTFLKAQVVKAENKISKNRMTVTSGKVIAEQTLGFWTDFFEVHHYKILKGRPIKVFQNLPVGHGREEACDILNDIRLFRNRIYHNEPIIFKGGVIDFQVCEDVHEKILNVLSWIDPDLSKWVEDLDGVEVKIKKMLKP